MDEWSGANPNIRLGSVNARLLVLGLTAPVLQESFTALNVTPTIKWKPQWKNSLIHNSVFLEIHFSDTLWPHYPFMDPTY